VTVPAGATLTIEPGVKVQLGSGHSIKVAGRLQALGSAALPILFEAATTGQSWGGLQLQAGSGPSEIAFAHFSGGGARRAEMLGIATNDALVRNSEFGTGSGIALEVKAASPVIRDSRFVKAADSGANPPAALRILGASEPVITGNLFQSNSQYGISMELNAGPRFLGNRFQFNAFDGVLVYGTATHDVHWPSLGARSWAYHVNRTQLVVDRGATLSLGAGATLKFGAGLGLRVNGALQLRGEASRPVLVTTNSLVPKPGAWREIWFTPDSAAYDEPSGLGSLINHAIIEYGSSPPNGQLWVQNASPRIANTIIRQSGQRGVVVVGNAARPQLVGVTFADNAAESSVVALLVQQGAEPEVSWSVFRNNHTGIRTESGSKPHIGPHNRFDGNATYAVFNDDNEVCVEAFGNDWGAPSGPADASTRRDACNLTTNAGVGGLVSDHVRYAPWEGQVIPRPSITSPQCGLQSGDRPTLSGYAAPDTTVNVYDNQTLLGSTISGPGQDEGEWTFTPSTALAKGSHVLQAQAARGSDLSGVSDPLEIVIDAEQVIDASNITVSYSLDGTSYTQAYQNANGCLTLAGDGDWAIRPLSGVPLTLQLPVECPAGATASGTVLYRSVEYPMSEQPDHRLAATFDQADGGPLAVRVSCGPAATELLLGTVAPEYDGFVYDETKGVLDRVREAKVTLYVRNRASNQWVIWNAAAYHGQTNPVITGTAGRFAFYPPAGLYRVLVDAKGFEPRFGPQLSVNTGPYVANIGLQPLGSKRAIFLPLVRKN
jgi:parallel beta-helix repeat protein